MSSSIKSRVEKRVEELLRDQKEPMTLWTFSVKVDVFGQAAGMKRSEFYPSLYDYETLLPAGWTTDWLTTSTARQHGEALLYIIPPGWQPGDSDSRSLLLGGGGLQRARLSMD